MPACGTPGGNDIPVRGERRLVSAGREGGRPAREVADRTSGEYIYCGIVRY